MDCLNPTCLYPKNNDRARKCHWCNTPLEAPFLFRERYQILEVLGSGGYGRTYKARDKRIQKGLYYAIKKFTIPEVVARHRNLDPKLKREMLENALKYYSREVEQLATLNHPQIPQYYDHFDDEKGGLYLVQAFIPGQNLLDEHLERGCLSEQEARELLESLLPVLQYLAQQQVVHRDIKPNNIIRQPLEGGKSQLFLIDFGGAKDFIESQVYATATPFRTPGYDSPEHQEGKHQLASDIYSLGATCLRLFMGSFPRHKKDRLILEVRDKRELWQQLLEANNRHVTGEFLDVLDKMLNYRLEDRYPSARAVLAALRQLPAPTELASDCLLNSDFPAAIPSTRHPLSLIDTWVVAPKIPDSEAKKEGNEKAKPKRQENESRVVESESSLTKTVVVGSDLIEEAKTYFKRGNDHHYKGEYDKAIADYNRAIELNPQYANAYNNRGIAYYYKGEYDKAIADYNRAIELNPQYAVAYNNRGFAYRNQGEYDKAIADYNRAIELNPQYAEAYNKRGFAYRNKGEYDKAIADYNRAIELNPNHTKAYNNRRIAYRK